jgi:hypothetical protein
MFNSFFLSLVGAFALLLPLASNANTYIDLSKSFVQELREGKQVEEQVQQYAQLDLESLESGLATQAEKLTFWINTYNGFVIYLLRDQPSLFEDRSAFFTKKRLLIGNTDFSFDDIEHGIIRNSRTKLGLGYFRKIFIPKHIRRLQIKKREARIHFALNCGARSCPPVAVYDDAKLEQQLTTGTKRFLEKVTSIEGETVTTTPLFSWFRGDFKGKKGIRKMLREYEIIQTEEKVDLEFGKYDWTLDISNFTDL